MTLEALLIFAGAFAFWLVASLVLGVVLGRMFEDR